MNITVSDLVNGLHDIMSDMRELNKPKGFYIIPCDVIMHCEETRSWSNNEVIHKLEIMDHGGLKRYNDIVDLLTETLFTADAKMHSTSLRQSISRLPINELQKLHKELTQILPELESRILREG